MNRTIADSISPTTLAALVGGQKAALQRRYATNGYRPKRRRYGVCDTITPLDVRDAFKAKDVRIMPKTAFSLHAHVMNGVKMTYRGIKVHADKRRNNLFAYRV